MKKCCFIGHRDSIGIEDKIYSGIYDLIECGITEFYSGGMGCFVKICERTVRELGGKIIFVPYNHKNIRCYHYDYYDEIICPFGNKPYSKFDIPNRNKWMVDNCDMAFCYVFKDGGAKKTLEYAEKKNKRIINIANFNI